MHAVVVDGEQTVAVRLGGELAREQPPQREQIDLERFVLRLPSAILAIDGAGRVVLANGLARALLRPASIRIGAELPNVGPGRALRELANELVVARRPLPGRAVEVDDGRTLRVSGTPARDGEPAIFQIEDVTLEWRDDQRKRDFIRNAAHQLRTPLAAIASAISVLEAGGKNEPEVLDRFLGHLRTHADRLTRLTRGLLVLARADSGEAPQLDRVVLADLLFDIAAEAEADVGVECDRSCAALAEPDLLREAIAALVDNAVKHAPESAVSIDVREADGHALVRIVDTGPGIRPEDRSRVLEPFFRSSVDGDGFGLGLSIASRAVDAMGGELLVGLGDTGGQFTIRLRSATLAR